MEKIINYTLSLDGAFPEEPLCGGVQGEHKATAVSISPDAVLQERLDTYKSDGVAVAVKIDAVTQSGELAASEKREGEDLFSPFYLTNKVTASGLDAVIVVSVLIGNECEKELCRAQIKLYFTPSPIGPGFTASKSQKQELLKKASELFEEFEEKAKSIEETISAKAEATRSSAQSAARHLKQIEEISEENRQTILEFTEGTTIVFSGGDASSSSEISMVVDENLSEISENPVQNKAITKGISEAVNGATQDILAQFDTALADVLAEINAIKETPTVEMGTDGIWQYEKWPDGIFKCFGEIKANVKPENEWAGGHYYASVDTISFPDVFTDAPILTVSVEDEGANFLVTKRNTDKSGTGTLYILSLEPFTEEVEIRVCLVAYGRWK